VLPAHNPEGVLGLASYREGVIYLDSAMDMSLTLNTLWHEAVHVAQQEILGITDEAQARWIALFVHTFLVNNPDILTCYQHGLTPSPFQDDDDDDE
jgi:hypothetical protein